MQFMTNIARTPKHHYLSVERNAFLLTSPCSLTQQQQLTEVFIALEVRDYAVAGDADGCNVEY